MVVACYNRFDTLAHKPLGTPAKHGMYVFSLDQESGQLTLLTLVDGCENPAFLRFHPHLNTLYACTESIKEPNEIVAFGVSPLTGQLRMSGRQSARGTSTCYITLDRACKHLLFANYWDSTIGVMPISAGGSLQEVCCLLHSPRHVVSAAREDHLSQRQAEPHAHAIVLDRRAGRVAYVPDLGEDCIKQFVYDQERGSLAAAGSVAAGPDGIPHGPRYLEFHPSLSVAYLVNELSSTVSVFEFDAGAAADLVAGKPTPTLHLVQNISTIPQAFPAALNTCGRITVDPSGRFVLVSNRGHNSIAVFHVDPGRGGVLGVVGYFHTRGRTPRHFQFDPSGRFLIVANQDTDSLAVFVFDTRRGQLRFTGHEYDVPSPNFVCALQPHGLAGAGDAFGVCSFVLLFFFLCVL